MELMQARRRLLMQKAGSPQPLYQEIDWLECTGTQYIKTDYVPGLNLSVKWKYRTTATYSGDKMQFGCTSGQSDRRYFQAELYSRNRWYCACNLAVYSSVLSNRGITVGTDYEASMDGDYLTVDEYSASPTGSRADGTLPVMGIFCRINGQGTAQYIHTGLRLYYIEIKQSGVLSANFVPCVRISDDKPGMYDTVSKTFYTNSGTGEFVVPE